jgi:hypothetical protein
MPFPPEPTREEDEEQVRDDYQRVCEPDARYESEDSDWEDQANAKRYFLLLIIR